MYTTKHELKILCNEVPRRVKYIDNLGHYTTRNFVNFMVTPCINNTEHFLLSTDAHNVKKCRVIKTF